MMKATQDHFLPVFFWARNVVCFLLFSAMSHSLYAQDGCSCPAVSTCFACSGGLVSLKLEYNASGVITNMSAEDDDGPLATTFQGAVITIPSRTAGQPFKGELLVTVDRLLMASDTQKFKTNCGAQIFAGQTIKHFKVVSG